MATTLGGKDPSRQPKKKLPLLMIAIGPKGDAPEPGSPSKGPSSPSKPYATAPPDDDDQNEGKGPGGKTIQPGEAQFHNQTQTCSSCEFFDPQGNDGVGECKMGVPEADFTVSDPDASQCKYFEEANESPQEESAESPEEEKAEQLGGGES